MIYNVSGEPSSKRVTSTELYGFVSWVISTVATLAFTLWAFVPDEIFHKYGIYYLPNRYYLLGVANWVGVTFYWMFAMNWLTMYRQSAER